MPVQRRDAELLDRGAVLGRGVADVGGELPARVALLHPLHEAVARDLGDHGRGGDRGAQSRRRRRRAAARSPSAGTGKPSDRHRPPSRADAPQHVGQRGQVRLVQPARVDPAHAARGDGDLAAAPQHARVQLLAHLGGVLLGVVQRAQRAQVASATAARSRTARRRRPAARPGSRGPPRRRRPRTGRPARGRTGTGASSDEASGGVVPRGGRCASAASRSRRLGR